MRCDFFRQNVLSLVFIVFHSKTRLNSQGGNPTARYMCLGALICGAARCTLYFIPYPGDPGRQSAKLNTCQMFDSKALDPKVGTAYRHRALG